MPADQSVPTSPLGRLLSKLAPIESREVPAVVTASVSSSAIPPAIAVRPVRETIGTVLWQERVADLFVITWIASIAIIPIYGYLVGKFRRSVFLPWTSGGIAVALAAVGLVLKADEATSRRARSSTCSSAC